MAFRLFIFDDFNFILGFTLCNNSQRRFFAIVAAVKARLSPVHITVSIPIFLNSVNRSTRPSLITSLNKSRQA